MLQLLGASVFITARLNYGLKFSEEINNTNKFIVDFKWIILSLFYYFIGFTQLIWLTGEQNIQRIHNIVHTLLY